MNIVESYNIIDVFIMGTTVMAVVLGFWRGFVRTLSAVAGLVLGVLAAIHYNAWVQPYLNRVSSLDPQICSILSMAMIFIGVQIIFVIIRRILDALLDLTRLSWLDRFLGGVMGGAAGFIVVAFTVQVALVAVPELTAVGGSRLVRPIDELTGQVLRYAPEQVRSRLESLIAKWKGPQEPQQSLDHHGGAPSREPVARAQQQGRFK